MNRSDKPVPHRWTTARTIGLTAVLWLAGTVAATAVGLGDREFDFPYDDRPRVRGIEHPSWFKQSFLDLREDLREARAAGKRALMVYFGQEHCAYCQALMDINFKDPDIVAYTRRHYEVVAIDIWGDRDVVSMAGDTLPEKALAAREQTQFTPSILFYDGEGSEAFRLRGYYPPYIFRAALEYVADGHYRTGSFREYLAKADPPLRFDDELIPEPFFSGPPHVLDRRLAPSDRPLVVFFEQAQCFACDVLHTDPLNDNEVGGMFARFEAVQLSMWSDTAVVIPDGRRLEAREWARELGLHYAPSLVFFDEHGKEIIRIDSLVRFFRLRNVLEYVLSKGYVQQPFYQRWRESQASGAGTAMGPSTDR